VSVDPVTPMPGTNGARYFSPDYGLMAVRAARAVAAAGPLTVDGDGRFWSYARGVWSPGQRDVTTRVVRELGERYRPQHGRAIEQVLRVELPEISVAPVPGYINMANGMVRWDAPDGPTLLDHHPEYLSTVQLPVEWNPDATCSEFDRFLADAVPPDDHLRVWEILGYLMMSGNPLQRMFLLVGGGGNGKGVLLHVIKQLLGRTNCTAVPLHEFSESQFATAELFGRLANICGDIDATFIEHTGRIKEMSGEDEMKGERKFGQPFYFLWWGKALFSANAIPGAADPSRGWIRRWEVVAFPYEPAQPDTRLKERLADPASLEGIAVRALDALRGLMARGRFDHGYSASESHREFAQRSNTVLAWIADECELDPTGETWYERAALLTLFRRWYRHESPSGREMSAQTFYERLRNVPGVADRKRRGTRGIIGLRVRKEDELYADSDDEPAPEKGGYPRQDGLWPADTEIN
jgi:putative DNA primase/helicase